MFASLLGLWWEANLQGMVSGVLYGIAELARGIAKKTFEGFMQVALVGKSGLRGYIGDVLALTEQLLRFAGTMLHQPGVRCEPSLSGKDANKMKTAEAGNMSQGIDVQIFATIRVEIIYYPPDGCAL